ncbi:hypothetical protein [Robertmurraya andreesenii]|uniref:Preprotein translocase subunit YajC n=1 Tax=Anoxybacillus andreesenii TaxID=1325932 RepID=A0ABT9V8S4_9BACL|nr:hypothetical protein [Robertmurraya andreesenii]MDQ0157307.1 preprotein translocase subunit YajC [Robertmurraya andreesenii]
MLNWLKNNSFLLAVLVVSSTAIVMMIAQKSKETPETAVESNRQIVSSEVAAATTNEVVETGEGIKAQASEQSSSGQTSATTSAETDTTTDGSKTTNSQAQSKSTASSTNSSTSSSTETAQKKVTTSTNSSISSGTGNVFRSLEGKVTAYSSNQITIDVPIEGKLTFAINNQTIIHDQYHPIGVGSLVDVDAQGNVAYKIETERVVEGHGTIVNVTNNSVTLEKNGKQVTFAKAPQFYMDTDGYRGNLAGLWAEYTLTSENKIIGLDIEIDDQYDDYDDDDRYDD